MASFDFLEAASKGYEFVWRERAYLLRVAIPVIFVKIACELAVVVLGAEQLFLRQGLIHMPGYVLEAIFVIGLLRYMLYAEPIHIWGKPVKHENPTKPLTKTHGKYSPEKAVKAAIAMFLIIKVAEVTLFSLSMDLAPTEATVPSADAQMISPFIKAFFLFVWLAAFTWLFRLLWLYIPLAMGHSVRGFLTRVAGLRSSIFMLATWTICFLPLMILFIATLQILGGIFTIGSAPFVIATAIVKSIAEIIIISVQVTAMATGFLEIYQRRKKTE